MWATPGGKGAEVLGTWGLEARSLFRVSSGNSWPLLRGWREAGRECCPTSGGHTEWCWEWAPGPHTCLCRFTDRSLAASWSLSLPVCRVAVATMVRWVCGIRWTRGQLILGVLCAHGNTQEQVCIANGLIRLKGEPALPLVRPTSGPHPWVPTGRHGPQRPDPSAAPAPHMGRPHSLSCALAAKSPQLDFLEQPQRTSSAPPHLCPWAAAPPLCVPQPMEVGGPALAADPP